MQALDLYAIVANIDLAGAKSAPEQWTIDGKPLTAEQLEVVRSATPEDAQAVHDLTVLDARAAGFKLRCGCGAEDDPPT